MNAATPPRVVADGPLADAVLEQLRDQVEFVDWPSKDTTDDTVSALYTYGHPTVDGALLDSLPGVRVISNYGVGVDHIDVPEANRRGIVVGNTPGILDGATADMAFTLLLAAGRRLVEGDRYARSDAFTTYDPGYMLGREIHHATLGIVGMGRIGLEIAKRARAFDMTVLYHNRRRRGEIESRLPARYVAFEELLAESDYVMLSTPLTDETRGLIGRRQFALMKPTATLVNIARGPVVDTEALTEALQRKRIFAAAVDVTDPEPLPRRHPLLALDNLTIAPHLGSATVETRQKMTDISVENLLRGLRGENLLHTVGES
ncbi:MAG: D-glycerate dehydrogenase [Pirellulaceae bacterium]